MNVFGEKWLFWVAGIIVIMMGFWLKRYIAETDKRGEENRKAITDLTSRLNLIESKVGLFWSYAEGVVKEGLKQPTHLRKDDLLERFPNLDDDEMTELKCIILKEKEDYTMTKNYKALLAALLLAMIDAAVRDRQSPMQIQSGGCR